ncbi:MAG: CpXC domain-containing protein [Alphaproteobacteria bacterium]
MSKFEVHTVRCPACGHSQEVELYVSINADRMPEATGKLIDGSWEHFVCTACADNFRIDHRLLYTDLPLKRWIVQHPWSTRGRFATLEAEAVRVFREEYLERPPPEIRRQAEGISPRICFGRPQLAEKLILWRLGIDDRALESFKLVLLRNHLEQLMPLGPCELQLIAATQAQLEFMVVSLGSGTALDRLQAAAGEFRRVADDLDAFRPAFPDLFDHAYVNASRYLL